jgi:hypothetical protein
MRSDYGQIIGEKSNADVFNGAVIYFESGFTVNHHNDAQLFTTLGAERFGEGFRSLQSNKVSGKAVDETLDYASLTSLEITE